MRLYDRPLHYGECMCNDTYRTFCPETLCWLVHAVLDDFLQHTVDEESGYVCVTINFVLICSVPEQAVALPMLLFLSYPRHLEILREPCGYLVPHQPMPHPDCSKC